MSIFFIFLF